MLGVKGSSVGGRIDGVVQAGAWAASLQGSFSGLNVMEVTLVMFHSDGKRRDIELKRETTVLGRSEESDLQIPLATVSRKHAEIVMDELDNSVRLRDRGSSNGTYVNDQRVTEVTLSPGDVIKIGPVVFTVQIDGEPAEIEGTATVLPADDAGEPVEHHEETVDTGDGGHEALSLDGLPREGGAEPELGLEDVAARRQHAAEDDGLALAEDDGLPLAEAQDGPAAEPEAEATEEGDDLALPVAEEEEPVEEEEPASDPLAALAAMSKAKPRK